MTNLNWLIKLAEISGIGGIALAVFLILFREILRKNIFPTLKKEDAYKLLVLIAMLVWTIAVIGIGAWLYTYSRIRTDEGLDKFGIAHNKPTDTISLDEEGVNRMYPSNGKCQELFLNLERGAINGISAESNQQEIKEVLPCYTGVTENGSVYNEGGGVFYLNHDFYIYTLKHYMEFRKRFDGKMTDEIFGKTRGQIEALYGKPLASVEGSVLYTTGYGCLVFEFASFRLTNIKIFRKDNCAELHSSFVSFKDDGTVRMREKDGVEFTTSVCKGLSMDEIRAMKLPATKCKPIEP